MRHVADLYAGVGLFAATVGRGAGGRGRGVRLRRGRRPGQPGRRGRQGGAQRRGPLAGAGGRGRGGRPAPGGTGATGRAGRGRHPGGADRAGQLRCRGPGPGHPVVAGVGLRLDGIDPGRRLPAHTACRGGVTLRAYRGREPQACLPRTRPGARSSTGLAPGPGQPEDTPDTWPITRSSVPSSRQPTRRLRPLSPMAGLMVTWKPSPEAAGAVISPSTLAEQTAQRA